VSAQGMNVATVRAHTSTRARQTSSRLKRSGLSLAMTSDTLAKWATACSGVHGAFVEFSLKSHSALNATRRSFVLSTRRSPAADEAAERLQAILPGPNATESLGAQDTWVAWSVRTVHHSIKRVSICQTSFIHSIRFSFGVKNVGLRGRRLSQPPLLAEGKKVAPRGVRRLVIAGSS
jgi:hypothetical protein